MTKQKILEAAFKLFSNGHYNSVTLSQIAEKVNIKKPSIYSHFASKESLFLEVLDDQSNRLYEYIDKVIKDIGDLDTEVILQQILIKAAEYFRGNVLAGNFWARLLFLTPKDLPEAVRVRIKEIRSYIKMLILQLIKNGHKEEITVQDMDNLVYSYLCLLQGNLLMVLNSESFDLDRVNVSWTYYWKGIKSKK